MATKMAKSVLYVNYEIATKIAKSVQTVLTRKDHKWGYIYIYLFIYIYICQGHQVTDFLFRIITGVILREGGGPANITGVMLGE